MNEPLPDAAETPLRILLITRAPVGGLWRHVLDLTDGLLERGHDVGIAVDTLRASDHVRATLERFGPKLTLGVHTLDIPRMPGWGDLKLTMEFRRLIKEVQPDIVHGHGAKGGLYARLGCWRQGKGSQQPQAFYTPHGGVLHYSWKTLGGKVFLSAERRLIPLTHQFLFESQFSADGFTAKIGETGNKARVIFNGLRANEFAGGPSAQAEPDYDFAFVGEMRGIKGVDILLEALCQVEHPTGRALKVLMLGDGPMLDDYRDYADKLGLGEEVTFAGRRPVREAFASTDTIVVPSRAESLPYIVLEAIAAGKQVIATDVGGIGEIFGPTRDDLLQSEDVDGLAEALRAALQPREGTVLDRLKERYAFLEKNFHVDTMVDKIASAYREQLA